MCRLIANQKVRLSVALSWNITINTFVRLIYMSSFIDDSLSSSSMQNNDAQTAKTLTEAANVLNTVNREAGGPSVSSTGTSKDSKTAEPEPFWVNR